jgi:hypothetical protein
MNRQTGGGGRRKQSCCFRKSCEKWSERNLFSFVLSLETRATKSKSKGGFFLFSLSPFLKKIPLSPVEVPTTTFYVNGQPQNNLHCLTPLLSGGDVVNVFFYISN